jgi:uncharacterized membrane protein YcaP (DUF421 family)
MSSLFALPDIQLWELVVRTIVIYLAVVVLLRVAGKKQLGQMGPTEFVSVLLLSNGVQNGMTGGDNTLFGGLLSAFALVLASRLISWGTFKSALLRTWFEGTPRVLVQNGVIVQASLDRELLTKGDLVKMLRQQGVDRIEDAFLAVLDPEGNLTVARHPVTGPGEPGATPTT